jgi:plastocyanin
MRRRKTFASIGVVVLAAVAALAGAAQGREPEATITVGNNFLSPSSKTIAAGTKLRFRWVGGERHHIVKTKGPGGDIKSPPTSRRGVNLAKVLTKRGTYRFICTFHPTEMRTKVVVR